MDIEVAARYFRAAIRDALIDAVDDGLDFAHLDEWMHRMAVGASIDDRGVPFWDGNRSAIDEYLAAKAVAQSRAS
jgi:hypothetical protein